MRGGREEEEDSGRCGGAVEVEVREFEGGGVALRVLESAVTGSEAVTEEDSLGGRRPRALRRGGGGSGVDR